MNACTDPIVESYVHNPCMAITHITPKIGNTLHRNEADLDIQSSWSLRTFSLIETFMVEMIGRRLRRVLRWF